VVQTHVYRLVPVAREDDPNWDRTTNQGEVLVRAYSSGDARIVAAYGEAAAISLKNPLGTTQVSASAFRDEKLYHVAEDDSGAFPERGPRAVLRAMFEVPENFVIASD
jgi:hypothetical protein